MTEPADILLPASPQGGARVVHLVSAEGLETVLEGLPPGLRRWVREAGFRAAPGEVLLLPGEDGALGSALAGTGGAVQPLEVAALAMKLPEGEWRLEGVDGEESAALAALGWLLSAYRFSGGDEGRRAPARLVCPQGVDREDIVNQAEAVWMARDLVNTPAEALGPAELAARALEMAGAFGGRGEAICGAALREGWPLIHAVGRAAEEERAPRLIDIRWGREDAPRITLVGKGVCFDSGGLDIKPASAMALMKKDMGGAAAVLAVARMIMKAGLDVRLRVLIPAVENAVSGAALRPGDVLRARDGTMVEVGNTDAEGRLVLADALAAASEERPDLVIDMATLTGAARVALGPDLPALFARDEALAAQLAEAGRAVDDPLWPMPLWRPYAEGMKSDVAQLCNIAQNGFAGAIIAALFLDRFVGEGLAWMHLDIFAWNPASRPARPKGGEAQGARALFSWLKGRCGHRAA